MRKLIVTENITLDGVIEVVDDWFAPSEGGDDIAAANREHMAAADAVLLGRVTYEQFAGYWPKQTDDTTGVREYLNRTRKYVVSSTLAGTDWQNTTILRGALADGVSRYTGGAATWMTPERRRGLAMATIVFADQDSYERATYLLDEIGDWVRVVRNPDASDPRPWHIIPDQHVPSLRRRLLEAQIAYDLVPDGRGPAATTDRRTREAAGHPA